jgi:hypothetical protein
MRPVAKLHHETDPPDSNSHHADSDAKIGCRPDRTGDNPDDASKDDRERRSLENALPPGAQPLEIEIGKCATSSSIEALDDNFLRLLVSFLRRLDDKHTSGQPESQSGQTTALAGLASSVHSSTNTHAVTSWCHSRAALEGSA